MAFSNVGLPGGAIHGKSWDLHRECLARMVYNLLISSSWRVVGILLNEVGNLDDLLDTEAKEKFTEMLNHGFKMAGFDKPTVLWSDGETVAAFHSQVTVERLPTLTTMPGVHSWRVVERFELSGATEHGPVKMLVYNNHQPSSDKRPFPPPMRIKFCLAILHDAIRWNAANSSSCGWVFGGDANCSLAVWMAALHDVRDFRIAFGEPRFLHSLRGTRGAGLGGLNCDVVVAAPVKNKGLSIYDNKCDVPGRERQHENIYYQWSYRPRAVPAPKPLPANRWPPPPTPRVERQQITCRTPSSGAAEHTQTLSSGAAEHTRPQKNPDEEEHTRPQKKPDEEEHTRPQQKPHEDKGASPPAQMCPMDADVVSEESEADFGDLGTDDEGDGDQEHEGVGDQIVATEHDSQKSKGAEEQAKKHYDELSAMGFAFAQSASLVPEFGTSNGSQEIPDGIHKPMGCVNPTDFSDRAHPITPHHPTPFFFAWARKNGGGGGGGE